MSTDDSYMDFLNKANQDPSRGYEAANIKNNRSGDFKTTDAGAEAPAVLVQATREAVYTSEADEPFVPVALAWSGSGKGKSLPDEEEFAKLIDHWDPANAEIQIMDPFNWDNQGQYQDVIQAVREAGEGNDVRVYRVVGRKPSRVEYWVVTRAGDGDSARLVGAKALSIES